MATCLLGSFSTEQRLAESVGRSSWTTGKKVLGRAMQQARRSSCMVSCIVVELVAAQMWNCLGLGIPSALGVKKNILLGATTLFEGGEFDSLFEGEALAFLWWRRPATSMRLGQKATQPNEFLPGSQTSQDLQCASGLQS